MIENSNPMAFLRQRVLRMILMVSIISFFLVAGINAFNNRPILNVVLPLLGSFVAIFCYVMVLKNKFIT